MNKKALTLFIGLLLCLFAIPLLGILVGKTVEGTYENTFQDAVAKQYSVDKATVVAKGITLDTICSSADRAEDTCSYLDNIRLLQRGSAYTTALGVGMLVLIFGAKLLSGRNRDRLALLFGPTIRLVLLLLAISIFAQGAIAVYGIYTVESVYTGMIQPKIIGLIGLGALVAGGYLVLSTLRFFKRFEMLVFAKELGRTQAPKIFELVEDVASQLGAIAPDHVVVGIEPNFYVTSADVRLVGDNKVLKGTTLYLSLPFMRAFSIPELKAVVGHELGHFKGHDTAYSIKFAPTYRLLQDALATASRQSGMASVFSIPALTVVSLCLTEFAKVERSIGRDREFEADKEGASLGSGRDLAAALVKVSVYSHLWSVLREHNINELAEGRVFMRLGSVQTHLIETAYGTLTTDEVWAHLRDAETVHPTDTHPPMRERLDALGINPTEIDRKIAAPADTDIEALIPGAGELDEQLTVLEHQLMVSAGRVVIPFPKE